MSETVLYEELSPREFGERLARMPVGYLPLGTIEWHCVQNALGADLIQSRGVFELAARRFGGVVFPPLWMGPDRISVTPDGRHLIGMDTADTTVPKQQLPGSCYWMPKGLFLSFLESIIAQAKRAGFKCLVADGHGPSRKAWAEMADSWERQFDIKLISAIRDFPGDEWKTQIDHAGRNETSIMLALRPDLVNLGTLPVDRGEWPLGVLGDDPRDSSAEFGNEMIRLTLDALGRKLAEFGFL